MQDMRKKNMYPLNISVPCFYRNTSCVIEEIYRKRTTAQKGIVIQLTQTMCVPDSVTRIEH